MAEHPATDPVLAPARIRYQDDQPYSLDYEDIYHAGDADAEVQRVFIAPAQVEELARARAKQAARLAVVRIGELGFGSGLNFIVAAERCLAAGARLHFVSCEAHPLDAPDFAAVVRGRADRHPLYRELALGYPPRIRGWHQRRLAGGQVRLMLWLGTADEALDDLAGRQQQPLDAWFLDGFAPDRNPSLWQPELFGKLAELSTRGTRVATFTAAGRVRRGLETAGFAMMRVDQRPHKRETLAGTFAKAGRERPSVPEHVTVAGGGLAGASAAWHLAETGCAVTLLDTAEGQQPHPPASTMPATVLHARLLADGTATAALRCHAYLHAAAWLPGIPGFCPTGALQVAGHGSPRVKLQALARLYGRSGSWVRWLEADEASALAGWPVSEGGLHLPGAGVVNLPELVAALTDAAGVNRFRHRLETAPAGGALVLAAGAEVREFPDARYLEVAAVQGQLDFVATATPPRLPLVGARYLVPAGDGLVAAGSTYEYRPWNVDEASAHNLAQLEGHPHRWRFRCRGTRSVSSDRTAIAGPLFDPSAQALAGRYVSAGHGSAGNTSAHLAAAVITAHVTGDCPPLAREVEAALSPLRFRQRQARRGHRHGSEP